MWLARYAFLSPCLPGRHPRIITRGSDAPLPPLSRLPDATHTHRFLVPFAGWLSKLTSARKYKARATACLLYTSYSARLGAPSGERSTLGARRSALTTPTSAALAPRPRLHSRPATHEHASGTRVLTSRPSAADFAASSFPMLPTQGQDCTLAHDSLSVSTTSR